MFGESGVWTYVVLGASYLWPWNSLITAAALARDKLQDNPVLFSNYSSSVMVASTVVTLCLNLYLAARPYQYSRRVQTGLLLILLAFLIAAVASLAVTGSTWFWAIIGVVSLASIGTSLTQNGVLAITQRIPSDGAHVLANLIGQAVAGVVPPIIAMALAPAKSEADDIRRPAFLFVSVSALALLAWFLFRRPNNRKYIDLADNEVQNAAELPPMRELVALLRQMAYPSIAIVLGFMLSLSYPVFANTVESKRFSLDVFSPVTHLVWNTGDLCGRLICQDHRFRIKNPKVLVIYGAARVLILINLLVLGNASDVAYLVLQLVFGLTGGHLISCAIAYVPTCTEPHMQPAAGGLLSLVISVGLLAGALTSFGVVQLIS